jgi:hypothetical protein
VCELVVQVCAMCVKVCEGVVEVGERAMAVCEHVCECVCNCGEVRALVTTVASHWIAMIVCELPWTVQCICVCEVAVLA